MNRTLLGCMILGVLCITTLSLDNAAPPPSPGPMGAYLNGVFPNKPPGANNSWELRDDYPGISIASPLRIIPFPGSEDVLIVSKLGEVWRVSLDDQTQELVLDIKDRSFKKGESGTTGIVLHPEFGNPSFPNKQVMFVFYRTKPDPDEWDNRGLNRLSKFTWDAETSMFDKDGEEILIQQYDRSTWHNGGAMFFGYDGFLYLALGDEGDDDMQSGSTQRLDGGFFSGILRIDVDNDPTRSHPIRRQPRDPADGPPAGWGNTFSQGYSIPNDNPWLSPDGAHLEEFYAIGLRSPYSTYHDTLTDKIWVADVGSSVREELNFVQRGDNLQWPFMEGSIPSEVHDRPSDILGSEREPVYEYGREFGSCIIGGAVYHGSRHPDLADKYLYGDFVNNKIAALVDNGPGVPYTNEILISSLGSQRVELPDKAAISGVFPQKDGEVLVTIISTDFTLPGKILRLEARESIPDPPGFLSQIGAFSDLENQIVAEGIIPYSVNSSLWSDRAIKKRWIALPNDGIFDTPEEQIIFDRSSDWTFPEGTVFIKHFELPLTADENGPSTPLETRFFVIAEEGQGYGVTYRWNDEGTEARLLSGMETRYVDVELESGSVVTQEWEFPGRVQCLTCHTPNAEYVLGVKTHQLNGDLFYPVAGKTMNQLDYLSEVGVFDQAIGPSSRYSAAAGIDDMEADLDLRIRSYLDANCASCHRAGGVDATSMDLRFDIPLHLQNLVNAPTESSNSDQNRLIVQPGDHLASELWVRDASENTNKMPPIGRHLVDSVYIRELAIWIDGLSTNAGSVVESVVYPNPTTGWVNLRLADEIEGPYQVEVFDLVGRFVFTQEFESRSHALDLTNLSSGAYVLKLSGDNYEQIKTLVIN